MRYVKAVGYLLAATILGAVVLTLFFITSAVLSTFAFIGVVVVVIVLFAVLIKELVETDKTTPLK